MPSLAPTMGQIPIPTMIDPMSQPSPSQNLVWHHHKHSLTPTIRDWRCWFSLKKISMGGCWERIDFSTIHNSVILSEWKHWSLPLKERLFSSNNGRTSGAPILNRSAWASFEALSTDYGGEHTWVGDGIKAREYFHQVSSTVHSSRHTARRSFKGLLPQQVY